MGSYQRRYVPAMHVCLLLLIISILADIFSFFDGEALYARAGMQLPYPDIIHLIPEVRFSLIALLICF